MIMGFPGVRVIVSAAPSIENGTGVGRSAGSPGCGTGPMAIVFPSIS